jgi:hypothetical protein
MRIPPEVAKHLGGSAKRGFRVYNPVLLEECIDKSVKTFWILKLGDRSREDEFSLLIRHSHPVYEFGTKDGTEHLHGQEVVVFRVNPALMVRGESPGWNQAV